jgi:hypothetical protein
MWGRHIMSYRTTIRHSSCIIDFVSRILIVLAALPGLAQNAAFKGTIVDAVTKAPIAGAGVKLYRGEEAVKSVGSDAQGVFRLAGLPDGLYRVDIQHSDYMRLASDEPAARPFAKSVGGPEPLLTAPLVPLAQLRGQVLNASREPIKGVPVGMRRPWQQHWVQTTITGDEGRFLFRQLEPGSWILAALPSFRLQNSDPKKNPKPIDAPGAEDGQRVGWATTYFPNTTVLADAARIILRPGAGLNGHDIILRTVPLRRLSGVVIDDAGNPIANAVVMLGDRINPGSNGAILVTNADGRFSFDGGTDGEWRAFAQTLPSERGALKGSVDFYVSRTDSTDIVVRVAAPFPVTGVVEREEPRDKEGKRKVTAVYLLPQGAGPDMNADAVHEQDGNFVLRKVYAGRYRVLPAGYVPGYYVASIWYGNQEVTSREFDIVSPPLPLRIVYKSGAARATGKVDRGGGAWAVLLPQDEALRDSDQHVRTVKCDANGRFAIDSLRPGDYYAFAFDRVEKELLEDVAFVRRLSPRAVRVEARPGETATVELSPLVWAD